MRKRTVGTVVGAVCLSVAATGCSGGGSASKAAEQASESPSASAAASAADGDGGSGTTAKALVTRLESAKSKVASTNSFRMDFTTSVDGMKMMTVTSQLQLKPEFAMRMDMQFDPEFIEQMGGGDAKVTGMKYLMTRDAMYMNMGPAMASELDGKTWAKVDLAALDKSGKAGSGKLQEMLDQAADGQNNPAAQVAALQKSGDIREVGQETVDGVATTHYAGTVDLLELQKNSAESMGLSAKDYQQLLQTYKKAGATKSTIDLWIGADGLPVKQNVTMRIKADGQTAKMTMAFKYSDWGTKVDVTPPPASDTKDITQKMIDGKA